MHGILLMAVLIIVGGIIAFIGDRLGSKVGKKKLTLFGLRPRHTSIIVTIVTGFAITTITFGILAITSKDVRTALFGMEKLQQQISLSQTNLNKANKNLQIAQSQQTKMEASLKKTRIELDDAKDKTRQMKAQQEILLAANTNLEQQNVYLDENNNKLKIYNENLKGENSNLQQNNDNLQQQNDDLAQRNGDLSSKRIIYQAGELIFGGVVPATTDRNAVRSNFAKLITIANAKVAAKSGETAIKEGLWLYPSEYESAIDKICSSDKDMVVRLIAAANLVKDEPVRTNIELYPNKIVYQNRELVATGDFEVDGTQAAAQKTLFKFLHDINKIASANGMLPDPLRGSIGVISMDQLYSVTDELTKYKGKILLTAYSQGNTNILGPLRLILKVRQDNNE